MSVRPRGIQLVWWWRVWPPFRNIGPYPPRDCSNCGCVYRWRLRFGPLEIRRWGP
jgi:hypothetical protein